MTRRGGFPTAFRGVVFRSRLEANWARYFAAIGVQYDYEPPQVGAVIDFWMPQLKAWVEIKPDRSKDRERSARKARKLLRGNSLAVVLYGDPPGQGPVYIQNCAKCLAPCICDRAAVIVHGGEDCGHRVPVSFDLKHHTIRRGRQRMGPERAGVVLSRVFDFVLEKREWPT